MTDPAETATREGYCPHCDAERRLQITVAWQPDVCTACSNAVEPDG